MAYNAVDKEVLFCYTSGDAFVPDDLKGSARCNRAAVYNIANDTWAFIDLPNVSSATAASLNLSVATYSNTTQTYDNAGFTYASQDASSFIKRSIFVTEAHGSGVHAIKEVCCLDNLDSSVAKPATSRVLNAVVLAYKSIWMSREHHFQDIKISAIYIPKLPSQQVIYI